MSTHHNIAAAAAALLLCAAVAAGAGPALAQSPSQVYRCVDAGGRVTLTDEPCANHPGQRAVNDDVSDSGAVGLMVTTGAEASHLATADTATEVMAPGIVGLGLPRSRWADLPRPLLRKTVSTDAVTLQTARTTLLMQDELRRQGRSVATR
ncbi:hypothetical protein ASF61_15635 [Duganella sp. Leaf126]|uniref:DUF4124 domain-containing protein n=1 Tax=Duganella sp. Leaf126 TaxID=1736266 RepID=UPI0007017A23|nr:DUF4124 domain-containing protein [Duganella sp. Leaf126]KQQ32459.1 hypothetical protein ASF61_15635 [Duganella sp. Leaf126]